MGIKREGVERVLCVTDDEVSQSGSTLAPTTLPSGRARPHALLHFKNVIR
ncbi:MAG: hypothetical protein AAF585_09045 [Verrucomicrobiota bacterium]